VIVPPKGTTFAKALRMEQYDPTTLRRLFLDHVEPYECVAGTSVKMLELDGIPVKSDAQLRAWCVRYHRCGL
jgi:hypothetical protein